MFSTLYENMMMMVVWWGVETETSFSLTPVPLKCKAYERKRSLPVTILILFPKLFTCSLYLSCEPIFYGISPWFSSIRHNFISNFSRKKPIKGSENKKLKNKYQISPFLRTIKNNKYMFWWCRIVWKAFWIEMPYGCVHFMRKWWNVLQSIFLCGTFTGGGVLAMRHYDEATAVERRNARRSSLIYILLSSCLSRAHRLLQRKSVGERKQLEWKFKAKENMLVSSFMQSHTNKYFVKEAFVRSSSIFLCEVVLMMFVQNVLGTEGKIYIWIFSFILPSFGTTNISWFIQTSLERYFFRFTFSANLFYFIPKWK